MVHLVDERRQGLFQRLTFWWMNAVVGKAWRKELGEADLPLPLYLRADVNFTLFQEQWEQELKKANNEGGGGRGGPSLLRALWRIWGRELMVGGVFKLAWSVLVILGAFFFVRSLLQYVDPTVKSPYDSDLAGIILMVCFFLDAWLLGLCLQRMGDMCLRTGIKVRAALTSAVAQKGLSLGSVTKELSADIVGFVSSDIQKVFDGIQQVHYLWTAPIEALAILGLLTYVSRLYALPGYIIVTAVVALQYFFGFLIAKLKYGNAERVGARVALAQEVLPAMKLVKFYCWEQFFTDEMGRLRSQEQGTLWRLILVRATAIALVFTTPPLTAFTMFTTYEFLAGPLDAELAFTTLSLFNILRFPLVVLPKAIRSASDGLISLKRVEEFLLRPMDAKESLLEERATRGVSLRDAVFRHEEHEDEDGLCVRIPTFEAIPGEIVGIVGRVGSGKTSVLHAIMGRMKLCEGRASVKGSMGYVRQSPWLQDISCRHNILNGQPYEQRRYKEVVSSCALDTDFEILAHGDLFKAGPRGVNLSGGQRQRLNLARAVYSGADIMLLDSPLSAVDYHTARHIARRCIEGVLSKKCVVLVTHTLDLLPHCHKIGIMDEGKMVYFGPYSRDAVSQHMATGAAVGGALFQESLPRPIMGHAVLAADPTASQAQEHSARQRLSRVPTDTSHMKGIVIPGEKESAATDFRLPMFLSMRKYWLHGGLFLGILSLLLYILAQSSRQMSDYWVRQWVDDTLQLYPNAPNKSASLTYSLVYMGLMLAFGLFNWLRGATFFSWTRRAANALFTKYVRRTFGAPLAFFLNNPVGDLINVYSKDQDVMDEQLPEALHFTGIYGLILLSTVITVSVVIPYFSIFAVVLLGVSLLALYFYLPAATFLKVMTAESNGALVGLVSEALEGLEVIQTSNKTQHFVDEAVVRLNLFHRYLFNSESLNLWLAFYCDFFGAVLVLAVATFAVTQKGTLGAPSVGLAFSNVIQMLVFYTWVIRFLADTICYWGSTERVSGLALTTPAEADLLPPPQRAQESKAETRVITVDPKTWAPKEGVLCFENVWMRYRHDLPWALKAVSFELRPQEKIGIVGRTGSGKSSLLLTLYRMFEAAAGRVMYDGIDIAQLSREKLRRSLSVIPQEPLLFSGTLRANMDPYNEHSDAELWMVLEETGLKTHLEAAKGQGGGGLDTRVDSTSSEWSLGQKQLLCLARAVLTKVPVLCLDEATASLDPQTEGFVLQAMGNLFRNRTILTIGHRLDLVVGGDRVLVMERGEVAELDTPESLLSRPNTLFRQLVESIGPTQAATLSHMAQEAAVRRGLKPM